MTKVDLTPAQLAQLGMAGNAADAEKARRIKREDLQLIVGGILAIGALAICLVALLVPGSVVEITSTLITVSVPALLATAAAFAKVGSDHRVRREAQRMQLDGYGENPYSVDVINGDPTDADRGPFPDTGP